MRMSNDKHERESLKSERLLCRECGNWKALLDVLAETHESDDGTAICITCWKRQISRGTRGAAPPPQPDGK